MIEFLTTNLLWWHWIIFGLVLIVSEIFMPLFIVLWFGLSAVIVGLIDFGFDANFQTELFIWIILSVLFLILWFKFFKDKTILKSGQSDSTLGTKGLVTEDIKPHEKGKVHFESPVLGSSVWYAVSDKIIKKGAAIHIVEVKGQLLKVKEI